MKRRSEWQHKRRSESVDHELDPARSQQYNPIWLGGTRKEHSAFSTAPGGRVPDGGGSSEPCHGAQRLGLACSRAATLPCRLGPCRGAQRHLGRLGVLAPDIVSDVTGGLDELVDEQQGICDPEDRRATALANRWLRSCRFQVTPLGPHQDGSKDTGRRFQAASIRARTFRASEPLP